MFIISAADAAVVDAAQKYALGERARTPDGDEYIYLTGVGSTVATDWVTFDEAYLTTRLVANGKGPVAIAMAAVDATTEFGWYGINGSFSGNVATGADNAKVWATATAGRVDNTDVATDLIINALQRSATASNAATFDIRYPFALNEVYN